MYVSQVPATVLYTILKTILLFLLTQTIYSICAYINRYDLAKIFEQGNITASINLLKNKKYKKYSVIFIYLFIAIAFEIVIGLLPTIATRYMPFESVIISDNIPKYFKSNFSTPVQSLTIVNNSNDNMYRYCQSMNLCDANSNYYKDKLLVSPSMKVNNVPYDFINNQFTTKFANISLLGINYTSGVNNNIFNSNITNTNIYSFDTSSDIMEMMYYNTNITISYSNNNDNKNINYGNLFLQMIYAPYMLEIISIFHQSYIIYSDINNSLLLSSKAIVYNYPYAISKFPDKFNNIFNNSMYLYDILNNKRNTAYTLYKNNNSTVIDMLQTAYSRTDIKKVRFIFNLYLINDNNLNNILEYTPHLINNYNVTHNNLNTSIKADDYIINNFNDEPSNYLFTYAMLYNSNNTMYGIQGYNNVVADISPIFTGIIVSVIIILLILFIIIRNIRDSIYFNTLLEVVGITNLYNVINIDDKKLLDD